MNAFSTQLTSLFKRNLVANRFFVFATVLAFLLVGVGKVGWGQMTFTPSGLTQTQNFDGLPINSTNNNIDQTRIGQNWYRNDGTNQTQALTGLVVTSQNTSSLAHGVYNCASSSVATDRSVGMIASGSGIHRIGVQLINNTGSVITSFLIAGAVEKYRCGSANTVTERMLFEYSTNATSLNSGTWLPLSDLDLVEPDNATVQTATAVDGNLPLNRATFSGSISSLSLSNGSSIWIRWRDTDATGTDALLALDDVSITATTSAAPSSNADLSALSLSTGTLAPTFAAGTTSYTATVPNATSSITVTATRAEANATLAVQINNGGFTALTSGTPSGPLSLNVGANTIDVRVTAQDGTTIKTYTTTVTRSAALSSNADLSALTTTAGAISPAFAASTTAYTASVLFATTSVTVTATRADASASLQVRVNNGSYSSLTSGSPSGTLSLNVGANPIDILVTAEDGTTKTYTITVTRNAASGNNNLSALTTTAGAISPTFAQGTTSYTASVLFAVTSVTVTAIRADATASLQVRVNGGTYTSLTSGSASGALSLNVGDNPIDVQVTAQDGTTKTYTITVTRAAASGNNNLSALTTTAGALSPSFAGATTSYTASVSNSTASVTVTATSVDATATLQVRVNSGGYTSLTSGSASSALSLNVGANPIDVLVTAQDGTTKTYTITVTRAQPPIWSNQITGTSPNTADPFTAGQTVASNLSVSGIGRGPGITGSAANERYNATGWNQTVFDANDYFYFTLTPTPGYKIDFSNFIYNGQASGTGPTNFEIRSSIDGYTSSIGTPTVGGTTINLTGISFQDITSAITFRFYAWGGTGGTFSINDFEFNGSISVASNPVISISSANPAVTPGSVQQGTTNNVLYQLNIGVATSSTIFSGLKVTTAGTYSASDVTNIKAWYSPDANFTASGNDVLLNTLSNPGTAGEKTFGVFSANQTLTAGSTGYVFVTADIPCSAALNTISVDAVTQSQTTFSASPVFNPDATFNGGVKTISLGAAPSNVTGAGAASANSSAVISWTNPTSCFDEVIIVAHTGSITGTPTGTYTSVSRSFTDVNNPNFPNGGKVVYNGSGSPQTILSLTNGTPYNFKIFTRFGSQWSAGTTEFSATPALATATTDYFRSRQNGSWNTAGNWESSADSSSWITSTLVPTAAANSITIRHSITADAAVGGDQIYIKSGAQLTISTGGTFTLANGTTTNGYGGFDLVAEGGTLNRTGGTFTINSGATLNFTGTSTYVHAVNGGAIPTATWSTTSLCNITGITNTLPSGFGQQFGRVTWNCSNQSDYVSINDGNFNPKGLFTVLNTGGGSFDLNLDNDNILRTYNFDGGVTVSSLNANLVITFRNSATVLKTVNINGDLIVENGAFLFLGQGSGAPSSGSYRSLINLNGNLQISGAVSKILSGNSAYLGRIVISGATPRTFSSNADVPFDGVHVDVSSGTTLTLNSDMELRSTSSSDADRLSVLTGGTLDLGIYRVFAGSGTSTRFIVESGGTVITSNTGGLNTAIATSINTFTAGANYVFNAATTTPFHATSTLNNPGSITINADVTNNRNSGSSSLIVTGGVTINSGGTFRLIAAPTLNTPTNDLSLNNCALTINSGGVFDNNGENRVISGGGTPSIAVSGTFITRDQTGFTGTNTTIPSIVPFLNSGSTVDYGLNGNQAVTDFAYENLRFSGGGVKTRSGATNTINGTITIENGVTLNSGTNVFGGSSTNLTMNGTARFITGGSGGTGTKPDAGGTYTLANTSTIEFSGAGGHNIRVAPVYGNIDISGANVSLSTNSATLTLQSGSTFTVKSGATFNVRNTNGFSGGISTAVGNQNSPSIVLEPNATLNYNSDAAQTVERSSYPCNLTLSNTGAKTFTSASVDIAGNFTVSDGAVTAPATITFSGGNATVAGIDYRNLVINTTGTKTLSGAASIGAGNSLTFTAGIFNLNNQSLTLKSTSSGTASVGVIPNDGANLQNASNVTAERYIPGKRAWRGLSVPLKTASGSAFIWDQWQNGGTQITGVGALIWKPGGTFSSGDGYSAGGVSSNLLTYNPGAPGTFTAPASTRTAVLFNENGPVPYMLFATDYFRSTSGSGAITNGFTATTLRPNGTLYTGNYNTGTLSAGYHMIPNPYPSPITLSSGVLSSVSNKFWVWDPKLAGNNGYGGYVYTSAGFSVPTGGSYTGNSIVVPQGSAFWVESTGSGSLSLTEATKGGTSFGIFGRTTGNPAVLRVNLSNSTGDQLYDGVAAAFETNASAGLDAQDAVKFSLGTDNLSIRRSGKDLAIEFRPLATSADTIYLQLHNLKQAAYRFEITSENLSAATGATAILKDRYLGTETPLQLGSGQQIGFQVDANAASAGNRFYIVFRPGTVTPVVDLNGAKGFAVYPNPVPAGSPLQVEFRNRAAGTYNLVLYSSTGVQVLQRVVQHGGGTAVQSVELPQQLPAGLYIAEFTDAKGGKQQLKINLQ